VRDAPEPKGADYWDLPDPDWLTNPPAGAPVLHDTRKRPSHRDQSTDEAREASIEDWPEPLDLIALAHREPKAPQFILRDWLPCDYATLFAGHGGAGKSGIALHLAACIALERPFFGVPCEQRRLLYLSCEDRWPVLHWRLTHIARHFGIELDELSGELFVEDLVGEDTILWERDPRTGFTTTAGFACLRRRMESTGAQVLIVDGVSDTFSGNENARGDVKRYVNGLLSLIPPDGALLLVGHVAKPTAANSATSEGYSGSTSWHNAVRARWYLYPEREQTEDGERAQPTGNLLLELQKSNLGPTSAAMRFAWDEAAHLFVGRHELVSGGLAESIRNRSECDAILRSLVACADAQIPVPAALQGARTAYLVLTQRAEFPDTLRGGQSSKRRRFSRHLESLRHIRHVTEASIRRSNRHYTVTIEPTKEGRAACATL
jgi:hypothetical protein